MSVLKNTKSDCQIGPVLVIGAGIGGLCAALRLANAGIDVTIIERHGEPGGKMRQVNGVDAGPTVLTMRDVFDTLFSDIGEKTEDHVTLILQDILARHWWPGTGPLDLYANPERSAEAIGQLSGRQSAQEFRVFSARAQRLFNGFQDPVMNTPVLRLGALAYHVLRDPGLIRAMAPLSSLSGLLDRSFSDPRLRQLFGRYATYVGGSPYHSPALLALIWQAEAAGVWCVKGGMHALARAIARLIERRGGTLRYNSHVTRIETDSDGVTGAVLSDGSTLPARQIVFNGDPRALSLGLLGPQVTSVAPRTTQTPRSLSANVWSFSSPLTGPELVHHNVFFCADPRAEFNDIAQGRIPTDPTLYICAEDRGQGVTPPKQERFEIIMNAPPLSQRKAHPEDYAICHSQTFNSLSRFGLTFAQSPGPEALTTPEGFEILFPGTAGSLYGQSPHGMTAALNRPVAVTHVPGLVLAGGGVHPGAGVPMAALSGRHAAEAILRGRTSTLPSRQTATRGGISTA
ncbi:hypothetical protein P775_06200 [Puniceibacterium antarcticum]|uniref:Amine oxidase domain-containing protein n=1 Tax=Puniceibacterium antarcticum TaxID=1206336 RepID=A0A2G8RHQ8_9RHOB|nr:1-hydroxycarotenoid 3,4-desaturase CrtD [Puniceibacterium antarcticum]PIL21136.1 hypothetical protein P775_06200 [Puniceibacterium antarcticum]